MKMTLKRFDDLFCAAEPVDKDTVLTLMDGAGLCAYGEHSGNYSVPVEIMHNRLARIIAVAIQIGKQSDNIVIESREQAQASRDKRNALMKGGI